MFAKTYTTTAMGQLPFDTRYRDDVITIPRNAKNSRNFFFDDPLSAIAPRIGAINAIKMDPMELANPNLAVLTIVSVPALQYCLKNIGKKKHVKQCILDMRT